MSGSARSKTKASISTMELALQCRSKELMLGRWCCGHSFCLACLKPWIQIPALHKLHIPVIQTLWRYLVFKVENSIGKLG